MGKQLMNKSQEYREALLIVAIQIADMRKEEDVPQGFKDKLGLLYDEIEELIGLRDKK